MVSMSGKRGKREKEREEGARKKMEQSGGSSPFRGRGTELVRRGRDKGEVGEGRGIGARDLGGWKDAVFSICRKQRAVDKICIIPHRISERNSLLYRRCRRFVSIVFVCEIVLS